MQFPGLNIETPPVLADERLHALFEYWLSLARDAGGLPPVRTFDPLRLPKLLPNVWILEVEPETHRFRMRLAGEAINAIYRRNIGGQYFSDLFESHETEMVVERYTRALTEPAIFRAVGTVYSAAGRFSLGERISFPMIGRSGATDTMLGITVYDERLVEPSPLQVMGGVPTFYGVRAANHRPPRIVGG